MWERGLKLAIRALVDGHSVAPHVGAWIETPRCIVQLPKTLSLPMWERGLKPANNYTVNSLWESLPMWERGLKLEACHADAMHGRSLPMWERGLKLPHTSRHCMRFPSLPMWERGLKQEIVSLRSVTAVVSLPMWERGLKHEYLCLTSLPALSLPMWERGLKPAGQHPSGRESRRSPCGSVD